MAPKFKSVDQIVAKLRRRYARLGPQSGGHERGASLRGRQCIIQNDGKVLNHDDKRRPRRWSDRRGPAVTRT